MEEFIKNITDQIRCVRARESVAKELTDHIQDQTAAYEESGVGHEEAVRRAVREMGDPVEIGLELDRIHRPQTDVRLIVMVFLFSLGGLMIQYIAGSLQTPSVNSQAVFLSQFGRQCLILLVSFGVMAGMYFLDYSFIGRYGMAIYISMTVLYFIATKTLRVVNGRIPALLMLVYLYVPVFAGILYRMRGNGYGAVLKSVGVQFLTAIFVYYFSGTVHAVFSVYLIQIVMLILAIRKKWFAVDRKAAIAMSVALLVVIPALCVIIPMVANPESYDFRILRIIAWLNPSRYPTGAGYTYLWIRNELAQARMIGASGTNAFTGDYLYVWSAEWSDPFILLCIVCTYGILAGIAVILAFTILIVHAFRIVKQQKNQLGFMISAACFMVFLFSCVEGVLISGGYYPVTSVQFPFLSSGVGATITYAVFIGLLLSIYRNEKIITDQAVAGRPAWRLNIKLEKK